MDYSMRNGFLQVFDRQNVKRNIWFVGWLGKWALLILGIILYTIIIARAAQAKEAKHYEAWRERYVTEFLAQRDAAAAGMPVDPYQATLQAEAEDLARVLYGVKDNSTDDLRTLCWCVFNRVDSPEYANSIAEVVAQPKQWMGYSSENPVLESLYKLAREELLKWREGSVRPCGIDFVFMQRSPSEIVLRNTWTNSSSTRYWRAKE